MTLICITLVEETAAGVITGIEECHNLGADIVEVRADLLEDDSQIISCFEELKKIKTRPEIIFTIRPSWEGGSFKGTEEQRILLIESAIDSGFEYIDLELKMDDHYRDKLISKARTSGVKVIVSLHDFEGTPDKNEIFETIKNCIDSGGDIAKVVCRASSNDDILNLIEAGIQARDQDYTFTVMSVGPSGELSRILAPSMGCEVVYSALDKSSKAYEGQIEFALIKGLKEIFGW